MPYLLSFISKHSYFFVDKLLTFLTLKSYYSPHHINFYRYLNFMIFNSFNLIFAFSIKTNKILKSTKFNYCIESFRYSTEQHSTWLVNGNISTGSILLIVYNSSILAKSLTKVAGLQLI